jgi:uncharacterized protein YqeY
MSLTDQLTADLNDAMKARDADRTNVLKLLKSSMTNERIKLGHELEDPEAMKVLQREAKQRKDSIEQYTTANRPELAAAEQTELATIESYLPKAMGEDELKSIIDEVVTSQGATQSGMGQVIGAVLQKVGAQADGGTVSRLVRERLSQ